VVGRVVVVARVVDDGDDAGDEEDDAEEPDEPDDEVGRVVVGSSPPPPPGADVVFGPPTVVPVSGPDSPGPDGGSLATSVELVGSSSPPERPVVGPELELAPGLVVVVDPPRPFDEVEPDASVTAAAASRELSPGCVGAGGPTNGKVLTDAAVLPPSAAWSPAAMSPSIAAAPSSAAPSAPKSEVVLASGW